MKIGILTFHRALNFGAVLQCYALYKTLSDLGHDVEVIDYRPEAIEKYRMLFRWKDFANEGLKGKLRYIVSSLALIGSKKKTARKFNEFLTTNIKTSQIVKDVNSVPDYYDVIFFGSDQIWNPENCEGLDKMYFGQFHKGNTKFIDYAASIGRHELIEGKLKAQFAEYIKVFDCLSVREQSMQYFLRDEFNCQSTIVCDPSQLLTKDACEKIANKPTDENYVLVFNLDGNPNAVSFARNIAKQNDNAKVIMMRAETNHMHKYPCELRSELSPAEFLGYIKYAKCIVTNSFHATSFSIIMQKDFYTLKRKSNNDRSGTILKVADLEDRMVDAKDNITFSPIHYDGIEEKLNKYKEHSLNFIKSNLE